MAEDQRWYDQKEELCLAIDQLLAFPKEIRSILVEGVSALAEQECKVQEKMNSFRSLGTPKVLALYKSKEKKRNYDSDPLAHRAVNCLFVLSSGEQMFMAQQITFLTETIVDYLTHCKLLSCQASLEQLERLTQVFVKEGAEEAKYCLVLVKQGLLQRAEEAKRSEAIREEATGFRVKPAGS